MLSKSHKNMILGLMWRYNFAVSNKHHRVMRFTKMHGIGNDYIYINAIEEKVENPSALSISLSRHHFGIGSDGLVLIMKSDVADFRMRMFNPDGTEAEMCGNASRCVAKYVYDKGLTTKRSFTIETGAGIKNVWVNLKEGEVDTVKIDMGKPILAPELVPTTVSEKSPVLMAPLQVNGKQYKVNCVSMGNPHCVIFTEGVALLDIKKIGPAIETHPSFPKKTNVEFAEVIDDYTIKMRVWERGTGETLACGTGACATAVAANLNGLCKSNVTLRLIGGDLNIEYNETDGHVYMTGAAVTIFEGVIK